MGLGVSWDSPWSVDKGREGQASASSPFALAAQ